MIGQLFPVVADQPEPALNNDRPFYVVGVGASAGGLEALEELVRPVPTDTAMAFVIVTHLAPGHESALPDILTRFSKIPVVPISDACSINPGHIYVLPNRAVVTMKDRTLYLHSSEDRQDRNPIDIFLASLAEDQGENAIGVVMSGGGTDGTLGLKTIKEHGGLTLAQGADGTVPKFDSMPSSAIASGNIDFIVPSENIADKLLEYTNGLSILGDLTGPSQTAAEQKRLDGARLDICKILRDQLGHDFSDYKEKTFMRRVRRRMQVLQIKEVEDFETCLRRNPEEVSLLFRDLLIGVTEFFRDGEAFRVVEEKVIPKLFEGKTANDTVRIWIPGCTTGEEVYSLAILMFEYMAGLTVTPKVRLFSTDIDEAALAVARTGRYPVTLLSSITPERLKRFFTGDGISYAVNKEIRDLCVFSSHSVVRDPPFSRIDMVSCRNLLIYLNNEVQKQLIPLFHYALRPGGYLFLGTSESITQHANLFTPVEKAHRIFQRRDNAVGSQATFPMFSHRTRSSRRDGELGRIEAGISMPSSLRQTVESRVLERFAPAHVVVNRDSDVIYYSARTGKYIEAAVGSPSRQLVSMTRRGLRLELRNALREAIDNHRIVVKERLQVELDDRVQIVTLRVEPILDQDNKQPLFLVLFSDEGPPLTPARLAQHDTAQRDTSTIQELERQLDENREQLQSVVEEYETALEELKSANEELISVNEELQSTNEDMETAKEETQSINEELHTVNPGLSSKVEELDRAKVDLKNLFESTEIATIFLDREMLIRNYTPAVTNIFSLIMPDRGRPITDIGHNLHDIDIANKIKDVLATGYVSEFKISRRDAKASYLMRLAPYRIGDGIIDGVLVTFVDVTGLVAAESHQKLMVAELNHRVRNMLQVVSGIAAQTLKKSSSVQEFSDAFLGRVHALAIAYELLTDENWGSVTLRDLILRELDPHVVGDRRIKTTGPVVWLTPKTALAFSLILHELTTNAVKYGALSVPFGLIDLTWTYQGDESSLIFQWRELGGPPATKTDRTGFGSELIAGQVRYELDGTLETKFSDRGIQITIGVPYDVHLFTTDKGNP